MPDLGSSVHGCPLASTADDGDSYSFSYSAVRGLTGLPPNYACLLWFGGCRV
jgi:hypothetical protein